MPPAALHAHLLQLVAAQLITAAGGDDFAFRHALVGEAVYATILRRERPAMHRAVAEALEGLHAGALDDHLPDLAHHYYQAGAWEQALTFARLAGEQAQRRHAPHEAHAQYTRALAAAEKLPAGRGAPPGLYRARGQVHELLGDFDGAAADYAAALEAARAAGDGRAEWQTLLDLGVLWAGRDYDRTGDYFRQALDLARALGDPVTLGHSLNRLGNWHLNREEADAALALHQEALALFEPNADRRGLAETLDLLGLTLMNLGDLGASRAAYQRALALFRELDDRRGQASSLQIMAEHGPNFASDMAATVISLSQARAESAQSLRLARAIGWRAGEAYALLSLASLWLAAGTFDKALDNAVQGQAVAAEIGHDQWLTLAQVALGGYWAEQLAFDPARQAFAEACALARKLNSILWIRFSHCYLANACVAQGDLAAAEAALADLPPQAEPRTLAARLVNLTWAELALARGDAPTALGLVERILANAPRAATGAVVPRIWLLRARVLAALGRLDEAAADLRAALPVAQELRPLLWRVQAALAGILFAQGQAAAAAAEAAAARDTILAIAATVPDPAARDAFTRAALARLAGTPSN